MARTDDFRIAPGDGLRYYAPESDRDRHDKEGGYLVLLALVVLVLLAMATGQVTVFYY
jgi:Flp pilus assembly protein TadG